jgi:hypothetical protein
MVVLPAGADIRLRVEALAGLVRDLIAIAPVGARRPVAIRMIRLVLSPP